MGHIGSYNCDDFHASFKVTRGTVFHGTKIPLQKRFLAIVLIGNAKKSLSSHQLSHNLDLNQKTAWYGQHHHDETGYTLSYVAEAYYKYNYRETDIF